MVNLAVGTGVSECTLHTLLVHFGNKYGKLKKKIILFIEFDSSVFEYFNQSIYIYTYYKTNSSIFVMINHSLWMINPILKQGCGSRSGRIRMFWSDPVSKIWSDAEPDPDLILASRFKIPLTSNFLTVFIGQS